MEDLSSASYQLLLVRLKAKDPAAVNELVTRAYDRLDKLVKKIKNESFGAVPHASDSVLNEAYLRLAKALETVAPPTPADFFRFAAYKVRQTLLDIVEADRREAARLAVPPAPEPGESDAPPYEPGTSTLGPERLAMWSELHRRVEELPEEVREVFVQHYYLGLSQAEISEGLGLHPKRVSRLWLDATGRLAPYLPT